MRLGAGVRAQANPRRPVIYVRTHGDDRLPWSDVTSGQDDARMNQDARGRAGIGLVGEDRDHPIVRSIEDLSEAAAKAE